jgi:hypothetical protein
VDATGLHQTRRPLHPHDPELDDLGGQRLALIRVEDALTAQVPARLESSHQPGGRGVAGRLPALRLVDELLPLLEEDVPSDGDAPPLEVDVRQVQADDLAATKAYRRGSARRRTRWRSSARGHCRATHRPGASRRAPWRSLSRPSSPLRRTCAGTRARARGRRRRDAVEERARSRRRRADGGDTARRAIQASAERRGR